MSKFDWTATVKPLLGATYKALSSSDLLRIVEIIGASREEILEHDAEFEPFYSSFVALSIHYLCAAASTISAAALPKFTRACEVAIDFFANRLRRLNDMGTVPSADAAHLEKLSKINDQCAVRTKQLILLLKGLCTGCSQLTRADIITLTALVKISALPSHIRATVIAEKIEEKAETNKTKEHSTDDGIARVRNFLRSAVAYDTMLIGAEPEGTGPQTALSGVVFLYRNLHTLSKMNVGSILLDVCLNRLFLLRFILIYKDLLAGRAVNSIDLKECQGIEDSHSSMLDDICLVETVLTLPLLEPLNAEKLSKICQLSGSCFLASVNVAAVCFDFEKKNGRVDVELNTAFQNAFDKSIDIHSFLSQLIEESPNAGRMHLHNFYTITALCLAVSVHDILQNFSLSPLLLPLMQYLLKLMSHVLSDLETDTDETAELRELNCSTACTKWQKFDFINRRIPIIPFFFKLASFALKNVRKFSDLAYICVRLWDEFDQTF
ncbi:unnamed protein product [Soboliphyme baturini]|uniref:HECT domain-containing protein n=1 Tax=Soboliphyme baturini TaxID=241478 RepID=A0A183IWT0_9BILA|nr:unnamed protein product [Soboliphyme baturini]